MKYFKLSVFVLAMLCMRDACRGEQGLPTYPLRCEVEITPEAVHYGDVVFARISLVNDGEETVAAPVSLDHYWRSCEFSLRRGEKTVFDWAGPVELEKRYEWGMESLLGPGMLRSSFGRSLKPGESVDIGFVPIWVPRPEASVYEPSDTLQADMADGENRYQWKVRIIHHGGRLHGPLGDPPTLPPTEVTTISGEKAWLPDRPNWLPLDGKDGSELRRCGVYLPNIHPLDGVGELTVKPRSDEESALLQAWFLEMPDAGDDKAWFFTGAFAHPFCANGSPFPEVFKNRSEMLDEKAVQAWREEVWAELEKCSSEDEKALTQRRLLGVRAEKLTEAAKPYEAFLDRMKTRTPEVEERIARTKELERQLLERAERPESTISPMMKEFIILRGHLVDVRYATDGETRDEAFGSMLEWIDQTERRGLWTKYLSEIVLGEFSRPDTLPDEFLNAYRLKPAALRERTPNGEQR